VVSTPAASPAQKAWSEQRARTVAADVWQRDDVTIVKDPETGIISTKPRDGGAPAAPASDGGQQRPQPTEAGPATVDGGKLRVGDLALSADDVKGILAEKAARDSRAANTPATADGFTLDLPKDFELPPGTDQWAWDLETPHAAAQLGTLKQWAKSNNLDQPAFSQLLSIYAGHQIAEERRFSEARAAEVGKLGSNAPTRIDAVTTFLQSQLGAELAGELRRTMVTAGQVRAYEKIMRNFISQGVGGNPGGARDGAASQPERMSDSDYSKLSYHEKQEYAARFQQQSNGSRRGS
jgi:hypothetical protein